MMLILYTQSNNPKLRELILGSHLCTLERCKPILLRHEKYYILSLLYRHHQKPEKALDIWTKIASGELVDVEFEGISVIVDYLQKLNDKELIARFGGWVLRNDPARGIQIFIHRQDNLFEFKEVLEIMSGVGDRAKREYLENLIGKRKVKVS